MNDRISNIVFETQTLKHCDLCFHRRVCKYYKEEEHPVMHCRDYAEIKRVKSYIAIDKAEYLRNGNEPGFQSCVIRSLGSKIIDYTLENEKDCFKFIEYDREKDFMHIVEAEMDLIYGDCRGL